MVGIVTRALRSEVGAKARHCCSHRATHLYMSHLLTITGGPLPYKSELSTSYRRSYGMLAQLGGAADWNVPSAESG